jgi:hypothetical protein
MLPRRKVLESLQSGECRNTCSVFQPGQDAAGSSFLLQRHPQVHKEGNCRQDKKNVVFASEVNRNNSQSQPRDTMNIIMLEKLDLRIFLYVDRDKERLHRTAEVQTTNKTS